MFEAPSRGSQLLRRVDHEEPWRDRPLSEAALPFQKQEVQVTRRRRCILLVGIVEVLRILAPIVAPTFQIEMVEVLRDVGQDRRLVHDSVVI